MLFAHDTRSALLSTAALVCTDHTDDSLHTLEQLEEFVTQWEYSGSRRHDDHELARVRQLRSVLRQFWQADRDHAALLVNDILSSHHAQLRLARHDGWDWHLHATTASQPLEERMAVEAAVAFAELIRADEWDRVRLCNADGCCGVLVDLSKNRSKLYCDSGCGNRTHVAAYRARKAVGAPPSTQS